MKNNFFDKYPEARERRLSTAHDFLTTSVFMVSKGSWDLSQQDTGTITILNKTTDGSTVITEKSAYTEISTTVKDHMPSQNTDGTLKKGNFSMQVTFLFNDGKQYQVRLHNTDNDGKYRLQNMPEGSYIIAGWTRLAELTQNQVESLLNKGIKFTVKLVDSKIYLLLDGFYACSVALGPYYYDQLAQIKLCMNGNKTGANITIPFELN